jgi:hypothetical protein
MSITRAKQSSLRTGVVKYDSFLGGLPYTPTIGTATDGGTGSTVSVAFTTNNTAGLTYTALSSPGSLTGTSTTSPITVSGLSSGTAYTFQVNAANSAGTSAYSAASNSVTPATPSSFDSIASSTLATAASSVTFSSIAGTYKSLQLRILAAGSSGGTPGINWRFNGDTGANYSYHLLRGDGTTADAIGGASNNEGLGSNAGPGSSIFGAMIMDIHDYASTTKNKTVRIFGGEDENGVGLIRLNSSVWLNTNAITSITIKTSSGTFTAGSTFALYGIN